MILTHIVVVVFWKGNLKVILQWERDTVDGD